MNEWTFKIAKLIVLMNGLGQLALSQIHILASTKMFTKEIGFYLFFFIIFGLANGFNTFLLKKVRGLVFFIFTSWLTAGFGYIYLRILEADVAMQDTLTMADVQNSWTMIVVAIVICLVGSIVVPLMGWKEARQGQNND